jgi:hypothetical protein
MFALLFHRGRGGQEILFIIAVNGHDPGHARFPFRQGAGLIHHQHGEFFHQFDGAGVLDQNPRLRPAADANHD